MERADIIAGAATNSARQGSRGAGNKAASVGRRHLRSAPAHEDSGPAGLPLAFSSFVGRKREQRELAALVGRTRLVTVTGPGGGGKSRLALAVAAALGDRFPDGVEFVALAGVADHQLVWPAIARALGIGDRTGFERSMVTGYVGHRRILLVVDNCEHLLPDVCEHIAELLAGCPALHVLVTSRAALGVAGEHVFSLGPLDVPPRPSPAERGLDADALLEFDAVRLFCERAGAAAPGFRLEQGNAGDVAELCRRLAGLPLALELAAGRLRAFDVAELCDQLSRRIGVLHAPHGGSGRQSSLAATLDWSEELISPPAGALWRSLSLFPAGATADAAGAVTDAGELARDALPEHLAELVDHSVVYREIGARVTRYRMLEVVRAYATERLVASGDRDRAADLRCAYYLRRCQRAAWWGSDQAEVLAWLDAEHANVIAVLEDAVQRPAAAQAGLDLAGQLARWWTSGAHVTEGRSYLQRLLDLVPEPCWARYNGLSISAVLASYVGEFVAAEQLWSESIAIGDAIGRNEGSPRALLSVLRANLGDLRGAVRLADTALARARAADDPFEVVVAADSRARVALAAGDVALATRLLDEALAICTGTGELWMRQRLTAALGECALLAARLADAAMRFEEAFTLAEHLGDWRGQASSAEGLARVALAQGDAGSAAHVLGAAAALWRLPGSLPPWWARTHEQSAAAARAQLGEPRFEALARAGTRLSVPEAWRHGTDKKPSRLTGRRDPRHDALSRRELEVLAQLALEHSLPEIAQILFVTHNTIKTHCKSLYRKLGVNTRADAVARARRAGLLD